MLEDMLRAFCALELLIVIADAMHIQKLQQRLLVLLALSGLPLAGT